jgi:hypothetical protein
VFCPAGPVLGSAAVMIAAMGLGIALCAVRHIGGGPLAPFAVHTAANSAGYLLAWMTAYTMPCHAGSSVHQCGSGRCTGKAAASSLSRLGPMWRQSQPGQHGRTLTVTSTSTLGSGALVSHTLHGHFAGQSPRSPFAVHPHRGDDTTRLPRSEPLRLRDLKRMTSAWAAVVGMPLVSEQPHGGATTTVWVLVLACF